MSNTRVPEPLFPYRHNLPVQMRFNDVDMFGHVNNTVYLEFFDLAKLEYFRAVMGAEFDAHSIALVVVNINCNFFSPTFIEQRLEVLPTTVRVGEKSVVLDQRIVNPDSGDVKCQCTTVMAGFDIKTGRSAPVSESWRTHLVAYEGRQFDC